MGDIFNARRIFCGDWLVMRVVGEGCDPPSEIVCPSSHFQTHHVFGSNSCHSGPSCILETACGAVIQIHMPQHPQDYCYVRPWTWACKASGLHTQRAMPLLTLLTPTAPLSPRPIFYSTIPTSTPPGMAWRVTRQRMPVAWCY